MNLTLHIGVVLACAAWSPQSESPKLKNDLAKAAAEAESAAKAYRAAGLPWEAKDLHHGSVKTNLDGGPLIREAEAALKKVSTISDGRDIRKFLRENSLAAADARIRPYSPALSLVKQASERPFLGLEHDPDDGLDLGFPALATVKDLARTLCLRAEVEACRQQATLATSDLHAAWKLSLLMSQDASLVAMLSEVATQAIVLDAMQQCASWMKNNPVGIRELQKLPVDARDVPSLRDALFGEAYHGLSMIRNLNHLAGATDKKVFSLPLSKSDASKLVRTGIPRDVESRAVAARHFQAWTEAKPLMDRFKDDPKALEAALAKLGHELELKKTQSYELVATNFPVYGTAGNPLLHAKALLVATRALLSAMEIHARTGKFPARIQDIPGYWTDPFTGKPLHYRVSGDTLRIYSLGNKKVDDGGLRTAEIKGPNPPDHNDVASFPPRELKR